MMSFDNFFFFTFSVLDNDISKQTVSNGFTACGFYPFDADAIGYEQLIKKPRIEEVPENDFMNNSHHDRSPNFLQQFKQHLDPNVLSSFKNCDCESNHQSENSSI